MQAIGALLQQRYERVRLIAQGGTGAVYEGRDWRLGGSPVALKQALFSTEQMRQAFDREANLLARLSHPCLPKVRDLFIEEPSQYIVMEFVPGSDLEETLQESQRPLTVQTVLAWADQILDTLEYLHGVNPPVIHRDIKPNNLKLTPQGHVMLLDFGLSKGSTAAFSMHGYTSSYAPIEQIRNSGTDARSDIYAFGATLLRLLTGAVPENAVTRLEALALGRPDPQRLVHELNSAVPVLISQVIHRAMSINREARFYSAHEMRLALRAAASLAAPVAQPSYETMVPTPVLDMPNQQNLQSARVRQTSTPPTAFVPPDPFTQQTISEEQARRAGPYSTVVPSPSQTPQSWVQLQAQNPPASQVAVPDPTQLLSPPAPAKPPLAQTITPTPPPTASRLAPAQPAPPLMPSPSPTATPAWLKLGVITLLLVFGAGTGLLTQWLFNQRGLNSQTPELAIQAKRGHPLAVPLPPSFINRLGIEFVLIPAGQFTMGSTREADSQPLHPIVLDKPFYLSKYETTQAQWLALPSKNPSLNQGAELPVENVSFNEVQSFIAALNQKGDGYHYRLPSEAEWEYAARAGQATDTFDNVAELAWHKSNAQQPRPVGQKRPNAFGLHDMLGNVAEWCADVWHKDYQGAPTDGRVWEVATSDQTALRVIRGESWNSAAEFCYPAYRNNDAPQAKSPVLGFRLLAESINTVTR